MRVPESRGVRASPRGRRECPRAGDCDCRVERGSEQMEATIRAVEQEEQSAKARRALEQVCARGDFEAARDLYRPDFIDHVNRLEFRGHSGIRESVGMYQAIFPDLRITVEDQVTEGDRVTSRWTMHGTYRGRARDARGHHDQPLRRWDDRRGLDRFGHARPRAAVGPSPLGAPGAQIRDGPAFGRR